MSDLGEFLLARIAEDEQGARMGGPGARWRTARLLWEQSRSIGNWHNLSDEKAEEWAKTGDRVLADLVGGCYWDPTRVLAECKAKRQIVELHRLGGTYIPGDDARAGFDYCATCGSGEPYEYPTEWPCQTLRLLALPYADHEDYRSEWAT